MPKLKVVIWSVWLLSAFGLALVCAKSDPGKTSTVLTADNNMAREQRLLLANSLIYVKIDCDAVDHDLEIKITWTFIEQQCLYDDSLEVSPSSYLLYLNGPETTRKCNNHMITLPPYDLSAVNTVQPGNASAPISAAQTAAFKESLAVDATVAPGVVQNIQPNPVKQQHPLSPPVKPLFVIPRDGIYDLKLNLEPTKVDGKFDATVRVEILGPHGYISATDWPLLPFYCIMCVVYVVYGIIWLVVSFMQWRDLLRIQFWIGGVILLGMLEKAFFYAQYNSLNRTGVPVQGAELVAEFVSCAKRTLARMLVIIMSLGFGIVKPRLGPMLHRVVGVGALYFVLACVESYLRVMRTKTSERNELLVASIPLAVLDTGICWWIFTSLVQTTRTLRLRRNMVKLSLYRHFTNTLIFSVLASVLFMMYALHLRKIDNCTPGWKDIWIDTAFWHVLFSVLLLVIMILWRPTNNNQRYAFTPLLDNPEDEDDEEEDQFVADAYGVKMRGTYSNGARTPPASHRGGTSTTEEDDLRWVEENIPSAMAEPALPVLDSDEEIINTKFEVSKMQ